MSHGTSSYIEWIDYANQTLHQFRAIVCNRIKKVFFPHPPTSSLKLRSTSSPRRNLACPSFFWEDLACPTDFGLPIDNPSGPEYGPGQTCTDPTQDGPAWRIYHICVGLSRAFQKEKVYFRPLNFHESLHVITEL